MPTLLRKNDDKGCLRRVEAGPTHGNDRSSRPKGFGPMTTLRSLTLKLPPDRVERRRAWAGALAPFLDMVTMEADPAPGTLALTRHRLGPLTLIELEAPPQTLRRTPQMAGQGLDELLFLFLLEGEAYATWPDGMQAFSRLQGVVLDLAQPVVIAAGLARATGLVLPRALVAELVPNAFALHGARLDPAADPVIRLFFTCVQDLAETASTLSDDRIPQATWGVALLAAAALRSLASGASSVARNAMVSAPTCRLAEAVA